VSAQCNLLVNPGFEQGNTGFISSYTYTPLPGQAAPGRYSIVSNSNSFNTCCWASCGPRNGSLMMVVDGDSTLSPSYGDACVTLR